MNVKMTKTGTLTIQIESEIEAYAIRTWIEDNMKRNNDDYSDSISSGSFSILSQNLDELTDIFLDGKK